MAGGARRSAMLQASKLGCRGALRRSEARLGASSEDGGAFVGQDHVHHHLLGATGMEFLWM